MSDNKNKGGRPRKQLEDISIDGWELLEQLAPWTHAEYIAEQLGVSPDTLDRRIKERYSYGFAEYKKQRREGVNISIRQKQVEEALKGNPTLLIWAGKQYCGQSEKVETRQKITTIEELISEEDDE